jgi:hypothetical protein
MPTNQEIKNIFPHGKDPHRITQALCAEILTKRGFTFAYPMDFKTLLDIERIPDIIPQRRRRNNGTETHWLEVMDTHANLPDLKKLKGFESIIVVRAINLNKRLRDEYKRLEMELPE